MPSPKAQQTGELGGKKGCGRKPFGSRASGWGVGGSLKGRQQQRKCFPQEGNDKVCGDGDLSTVGCVQLARVQT